MTCLIKNQQHIQKNPPWDQMDAFEDAKTAGSHHCEAAASHLKGQGNQRRFLMTGQKPDVMLNFKNAKEEDRGIYRMFSLTSVPKKI